MSEIVRLPRKEAVAEYKKFLKARFKKLPKSELIIALIDCEMVAIDDLEDAALSVRMIMRTKKYGIEEKKDASVLEQGSPTST